MFTGVTRAFNRYQREGRLRNPARHCPRARGEYQPHAVIGGVVLAERIRWLTVYKLDKHVV